MQRRKPIFIGTLIKQSVADNRILTKGMQEGDIVNAWREAAGEVLYSCTLRSYIRNGRFFIELSTSAAKAEFYRRRYQILKDLNTIAGSEVIKFIQIL